MNESIQVIVGWLARIGGQTKNAGALAAESSFLFDRSFVVIDDSVVIVSDVSRSSCSLQKKNTLPAAACHQ